VSACVSACVREAHLDARCNHRLVHVKLSRVGSKDVVVSIRLVLSPTSELDLRAVRPSASIDTRTNVSGWCEVVTKTVSEVAKGSTICVSVCVGRACVYGRA
jgi:hypothetical protein